MHTHRSVCSAVWLLYGWCQVELLPSRLMFCVVHHTTNVDSVTVSEATYVRSVHVCLAVTCHLHSVLAEWLGAFTFYCGNTSCSGTFLQTLPDLVTPLKRNSLSPCSCPPMRSAPSEKENGYWYDCGSNPVPKHARKHQAHPPRVKKEFRLDSNNSGFILPGVSNMVRYKTNISYNLSL